MIAIKWFWIWRYQSENPTGKKELSRLMVGSFRQIVRLSLFQPVLWGWAFPNLSEPVQIPLGCRNYRSDSFSIGISSGYTNILFQYVIFQSFVPRASSVRRILLLFHMYEQRVQYVPISVKTVFLLLDSGPCTHKQEQHETGYLTPHSTSVYFF